MQTTFEKLGGTYQQEGDYLLPNIEVPVSPQIGIWGQRRLQHLRTNKRVLYTTMLLGGTLKDHLALPQKAMSIWLRCRSGKVVSGDDTENHHSLQ